MTLIRQIRKENRYTQKQFADLLGLNYYTYRAYDKGSREVPPKILAKVLRIRGNDSDLKLAQILEDVYD